MDLQFVRDASLRLISLISCKSVFLFFFSVFPFFDPHRFRSRFVVAPNSTPFLRFVYCLLFYYFFFFFPPPVAMIQCSCLRVFVWHCCNRNSTVGAENVGKCLFDVFPSCLQFLRKLMQKCFPLPLIYLTIVGNNMCLRRRRFS